MIVGIYGDILFFGSFEHQKTKPIQTQSARALDADEELADKSKAYFI